MIGCPWRAIVIIEDFVARDLVRGYARRGDDNARPDANAIGVGLDNDRQQFASH
jgi:hypothetical protein